MFGTSTCPNFQDKMPLPSHIVKKRRPPHHPLPPGLSPHLEDQELLPLTKANLRHRWHRYFPWHCKRCFNRLNSIRIIWIQFGSPLKYQGNLGEIYLFRYNSGDRFTSISYKFGISKHRFSQAVKKPLRL